MNSFVERFRKCSKVYCIKSYNINILEFEKGNWYMVYLHMTSAKFKFFIIWDKEGKPLCIENMHDLTEIENNFITPAEYRKYKIENILNE